MQINIFKAAKQVPRKVQLKYLKNRFGGLFDIGFFYYSAADIFKPNLEYGEYIDPQQKKSYSPMTIEIRMVKDNAKRGVIEKRNHKKHGKTYKDQENAIK